MEITLNKEQEIAVKTNKSKVLVAANAGAGKTRVITERVKYLLEQGENPKNIYAITYTNMAANEMRERINNPDIFIGTIHSLANRILIINGIDTSDIIEEEEFDKLFSIIEQENIELPQVDHLLIDEFQDICDNEYEFTMNILKPKNFFVCGDSAQSIYSFKGSNYKYFMNLVNNPFVYTYELKNNYRCGLNIINFGEDFLGSQKDIYKIKAKCMSGINGDVSVESFNLNRILELLKEKDFKDWFVLCRTNNEIEQICYFLTKNHISNITFKKSEMTEVDMKKELSSNKVKVLTIHSAKGLESKNVIVIGARKWGAEELRICYVAATRAKEKLIWMTNSPKKKTSYKMKEWD